MSLVLIFTHQKQHNWPPEYLLSLQKYLKFEFAILTEIQFFTLEVQPMREGTLPHWYQQLLGGEEPAER